MLQHHIFVGAVAVFAYILLSIKFYISLNVVDSLELLNILQKALFNSPNPNSILDEREDKLSSFNFFNIKKLFPFIRPHIKKGLVASIALIASTLLALPQPLFTKYIIDNIIIKKDSGLLLIIICILLVLILSEKLLSFCKRYLFFGFEQDVLLEFQHRFFQRILKFPKSFFDNKQTGYLLSRILGDVSRLRMFFSSTIVDIITNILKFIGGLIILFFLHWKLTLFSLIILPFFILSVKLLSKKNRKLSFQMMEKSAHVSKNFQESISGVELVKTFATEERETKKIYSSLKDSFRASIVQNTVNAFAQLVIGIISSLGTIFVLWYGAKEIIDDNLTIGSFVAFNAYLGYLYGPSHFLSSIHVQLQSSLAGLYRVFDLFELIPEDESDQEKLKIEKLKGHISLENVTFSYSKHKLVLKNISFSVNPGEIVAIVGKTGAGKSTLVNLIIHLYRIKKGKIIFDGIESSNFNLRSLRERIGIVSQEVFLFNDTIINNIRYGKPEATDEEVYSVSKLAHAHDFITSLDKGYMTKVGERGVKLSSGQRQRLSIARTLLKDPDILIFDEPTSSLDPITEAALKETIFDKKNNKTTFIIAHRLSTITSADKIIVLDQGEIVQIDDHNILSKQKGLYKKMYETQKF